MLIIYDNPCYLTILVKTINPSIIDQWEVFSTFCSFKERMAFRTTTFLNYFFRSDIHTFNPAYSIPTALKLQPLTLKCINNTLD